MKIFWPKLLLVVVASTLILSLMQASADAPEKSQRVQDVTPAHKCLNQAAAGQVRNLGPDMVDIPAGTVLLGEDGPGRPGRKLVVPAFRIDRTEVTNRQFAAFVSATAYVTQAEREKQSALFVQPDVMPRGLDDASQWWTMVAGADWRHPRGPGSDIKAILDEPVVHVSFEDAAAYARWRGHSLPTEEQWERAARGPQAVPKSPSSWAYSDDGKPVANTWQGIFPVRNSGDDGFEGLAPVGCFAANGFGVHDMIGNVWEWTSSPVEGSSNRLVKGGSYLCAFNYCANFRPAAWQAQEAGFPTSHIGFRTVVPVLPDPSMRAGG